jgi:hypothetical protein
MVKPIIHLTGFPSAYLATSLLQETRYLFRQLTHRLSDPPILSFPDYVDPIQEHFRSIENSSSHAEPLASEIWVYLVSSRLTGLPIGHLLVLQVRNLNS